MMWCNYPNMPTGAKGSIALFDSFVSFGKRNNILICHDNPYSMVLNDDQPISIFNAEGAKDVCLELNSLSKSFNMAGWRVGMVLGNQENIKALLKVKSNMDSGMFLGIQKGAIAALDINKIWFEQLNDTYTKRRKLIFKLAALLDTEFDLRSSGLFVWAKLKDTNKSSVEEIEEILQKHNLFITPGSIFGSLGEGYIRFSLCVKEDQINKAIKRITKK